MLNARHAVCREQIPLEGCYRWSTKLTKSQKKNLTRVEINIYRVKSVLTLAEVKVLHTVDQK